MISEGEAVPDPDDVPPVLWVVVPEHGKDLNLNLPLLVQLLLVLQDLHGHLLLLGVGVVHATEDDTEGATA